MANFYDHDILIEIRDFCMTDRQRNNMNMKLLKSPILVQLTLSYISTIHIEWKYIKLQYD